MVFSRCATMIFVVDRGSCCTVTVSMFGLPSIRIRIFQNRAHKCDELLLPQADRISPRRTVFEVPARKRPESQPLTKQIGLRRSSGFAVHAAGIHRELL